MIYGIGIDIIRVERMRQVVEKWEEKFLRRVFTEQEISYCYKRKNPFLSLAVRFAAKEALIKAIGSEIPVSFKDIEVTNNDTGKPSLTVKGKLEALFNNYSIKKIYLSLSHEHDYGVACVVIEK